MMVVVVVMVVMIKEEEKLSVKHVFSIFEEGNR
jgi:hypothetical protein